ncbi:hypothetical protein ASD64_04760 [Mesorhizobium sp. Root157]|uniref:DUF2336 domain-containing protein n=1 Tax=Mesorhizobium sp. Root157 TaxID=1736477 RepID=UPI000701CF5D|nr:DUF2336 domain-containing protein [Mesorhizobium sp. Root157]KQZ94185.1 hypothetical protein ASD64_04760 [Mesorhizobium sp. Root157]
MSFTDFRQIAARTETGKAERLFRAAISAFCSLTRPSRRELVQLDDLTLPLFDDVSAEGLRFAAAALSECELAPAGLVKRLSEAAISVAAPLLSRSRALSDVDLISLIGRHGLPHARAIARRKNLHPAIGSLIRALERQTKTGGSARIRPTPSVDLRVVADQPAAAPTPGLAEEAARERLREIMRARAPIIPTNTDTYARLRDTALSGNPALFQTALADALSIDFATARAMTGPSDYSSLLVGLRMLDMAEAEAFLIASTVWPGLRALPQPVRVFLDRYQNLDREEAARKLAMWAGRPIETETEVADSARPDAGPTSHVN